MQLNSTELFRTVKLILDNKINKLLQNKLNSFKTVLVTALSATEIRRLDLENILNKYAYPIKTDLRKEPTRKVRARNDIDSVNRCIARIGLNRQCSRSKIGASEFCRNHTQSLPYGRIDGPLEGKAISLKHPRGRRNRGGNGNSSGEQSIDLNELDLTKYIKTLLIPIDNKEYLIDENGVIYNNDSVNDIVARKIEDNIFWYI